MTIRKTLLLTFFVLGFGVALSADEPAVTLSGKTYETVFHKVLEHPWVVPEKIDIAIADSNAEPIEKAEIRLVVREDVSKKYEKGREDYKLLADLAFESDSEGKASILIPEECRKECLHEIEIMISKGETYVPYRFVWQDYAKKKGDKVEVPRELDVLMIRGEMIECQVLDMEGNPIEGVSVDTVVSRNKTFHAGLFTTSWGSPCKAKTDAEGKWKIGPVALGTGLEDVSYITFEHPDFIRDIVSRKYKDLPPIKTKQKIIRGAVVQGRVVDHEGKPIEGATLYKNGHIGTKTDAEGNYRFAGLEKRELILIAMAPGKAYSSMKIDPVITKAVDFILEPVKTIRLRGVDENGKPLKNIGISPILEGISENPFHDYLETKRLDGRIVTLNRAKKLTDRVVDENGTPVPGAAVFVENTKESASYKSETDKDGFFEHFIGTSCNDNRVKLFAIKTGKTPCVKEVDMTAPTENLEFRLPPGKPIRFRLVYDDGEKVPKYTLRAKMYSSIVRSCEGYGTFHSDNYDMELESDRLGRVTWEDAPDFKTEYYFNTEYSRFRFRTPQIFTPGDEEHLVEVPRRN